MTALDVAPSPSEAPGSWPAPHLVAPSPLPGEDDVAVFDDEHPYRRDVPELTPLWYVVRGVLVTMTVLFAAFLVQLAVASRFQQSSSQYVDYEQFRTELALGTLRLGPDTADGEWLPLGSPVATIQIPRIDVDQVVLSGTDARTLFRGPGHRRDSVLPGQIGQSVVMGRRAAYGGPFASIMDLEPGDEIDVTTGQGEFEFAVSAIRSEGDPLPTPPPGSAHLTLVTAAGAPFIPSGAVYVDAELVGTPVVGAATLFSEEALPRAERPLGVDYGGVWTLAMWLQALLLVTLVGLWAWNRWHRAKSWLAVVPLWAVVGLAAAGELARLLPNLL